MSSIFEYPILSPQEIVDVLAQAGIAFLSAKDLSKPTSDFVTNIYASIFNRIDSEQDEPDHVDFSDLEQLENPDHHTDSFRVMNFYFKIREYLDKLDCPEKFTVKDLANPVPDRTCLFLGAILNFYLHRDAKFNFIKPAVDELTLIDERRQAMDARRSQLIGEKAEYDEARDSEMLLVQEIDSEVKELRQAISGLNTQQKSVKASLKKLKERAKEIDQKISNEDFALVQIIQENANLHSRIVQSPDKLQRALEEKKSFLVEARNAEREAMHSFQSKTATLEVYTKAHKKMSKHFSQMQAMQEQVNSTKSIEKDVKVLKVKLSDEEIQDKLLEAKLVEKQGKVAQLDVLVKQIEKERDHCCEEADKELKKVKLEVESKRHDLQTRQNEVEAALAEADAITAKIKSVRECGESKCQELRLQCEEVVTAVDFTLLSFIYYLFTNSQFQIRPSIFLYYYMDLHSLSLSPLSSSCFFCSLSGSPNYVVDAVFM